MKNYAPPKLRQIVTEAVFRRKGIFLFTLFLVMALVVAATVLMPKKYEADAKLMVENVRPQSALSTSPSDRLVQQNDVSEVEVNSEVDLLESEGVARRALGQDLQLPETKEEYRDVNELQRSLTVDAVHQTNLIDLKLDAKSPDEASYLLQKIIDSYFQERAKATRSTGAAVFFEGQVQAEATQLDADQQALAAFEVQHQIGDMDDQKKLQSERVAALHDQLSATDASLARQVSQTETEKRQLSITPSRLTTLKRSITNQYSQERLNTSLVDLENHRSDLLKRYPPTDRQIVEVNEQIATTRRAIAAAAVAPATETTSDINPVWQQLRSAVIGSSGDLSGIQAQHAELERQYKAAQDRLDELEEATAPFQALKRKLDQTQADYNLYAQKRDEARISEALDKEKMLDAAIVQPPMASPKPVRPKPALYAAAGLAFALFLGTLLALYADTSAEQVYTPAQLDASTGMRTLATFADSKRGSGNSEGDRLEYRRLLFAIRSLLNDAPGSASAASRAESAGVCIAFTSALAGEGVTHLVDNLAREGSMQVGTRIAVLDTKALLKKFEAEENVSFAMRYNAATQHWVLALEGESGRGDMPFRQGGTHGQFSARLSPLLREARKEFDFLFLDCPSFQESTLAGELDLCVDGYIAVVSAGKARKQNLEQMAAVLGESRAPLLGYVLNRRRYPVPQWMHRLIW